MDEKFLLSNYYFFLMRGFTCFFTFPVVMAPVYLSLPFSHAYDSAKQASTLSLSAVLDSFRTDASLSSFHMTQCLVRDIYVFHLMMNKYIIIIIIILLLTVGIT